MTTMRLGMMMVLAAALFTSACATQEGDSMPAGSAGASMDGGQASASTPQGRPASGTAGDTLQACMGRIPSDASAGQRMFAEESCKRDQENRKSILAVPGQ
ncbi:MAG: hypothetical protein AB1411_00690 [Nitrospirota bacterium]